jgi:prepilin-type N-terminal cleavage/methylation domain-containing protein
MKSEKGFALIETLVALVLMGIIAVSLLSGAATATKATDITGEHATAQSLIRSEIEYIKNYSYQYSASTYPVDPSLTVPGGWVVPAPDVAPVHATDDGIQSVNVTAEHNGKTIFTVEMYKVDR